MTYKSVRNKISEGKAKILFEFPDQDFLIQHFKDDIVNTKDNSIQNINAKGIINNRISSFLMTNLNILNIKTHFIRSINMREQLIKKLDIMPVQVFIRNIATNDIVQRIDIEEDDLLPHPIIEFYHKGKNDTHWMVAEDHLLVFEWLNSWEIEEIKRISLRINDILCGIFIAFGIRLVDFKIEYGRECYSMEDDIKIVLADEITLDTCTLWDIKPDGSFDKKIFSIFESESGSAYKELANRMGILEF